jgi:Na+-translocating ferredoxin:NAD+ oxidoreductase RnfC subunit
MCSGRLFQDNLAIKRMNKQEIIEKVQKAGVVGSGGGGFPAHIKISASVDTVIANGAECEPLLSTDKYIMETYTKDILEGLRFIKQATGAKKVVVALKKKYQRAVSELNKQVGISSDIDIYLLENYYPAGDEHELVYNITGKTVPEGGIPLDCSTVVINVNTALNIFNAVIGNNPVIKRWITVAGEVEQPYIAEVPVGISAGELVDIARPKIGDYSIIAGGPMMGMVVNRDFKITKLCGGIILLPVNHPVVVKHTRNISAHKKRGASMCDQCFDCSIVCPRNLLGHELAPHKIMRNIFLGNGSVHLSNSFLCCECGLCNMFACPMDLSPRDILREAKLELGGKKIKNPHKRTELKVHPERDFRRVNTNRLMMRLGIDKYDLHELEVKEINTNSVSIAMKQHAGVSAKPVVKKGQVVNAGEIIGITPEDALGSSIHASIPGTVSEIGNGYVKINA